MPEPGPPVAARVPTERIHHGDSVLDEYEWLRDRESPEVIAHLEHENAYTTRMTEHLEPLRLSIFDEIKRRTQETDLSVPSRTGDWWYYARTREGSQYPIYCRQPAASDDWTPPAISPDDAAVDEQVLVDGNVEAEGHEFFDIGTLSVSVDGTRLAYSVDLTGDERYTVRFKDLSTGTLLADEIPGTLGDVVWSGDGTIVWYGTVNDAWRLDTIWSHVVGTPADTDVQVLHEDDERFSLGVERTTSDRYVLFSAGSKITTEVRVLDTDAPAEGLRLLVPRETGVEYSVDHVVVGGEDRFVVLHNRGALNFTAGVGPVSLSSLDELEPLIEPSDDVRLISVDATARQLVVNLRENGLAQVRVYPIDDTGIRPGHNVDFEEELFAASGMGASDWDQPFVRISYASWVTPSSVYELDPSTSELHLRKRQPILDGYDPADYVQSREWVTARDGTSVPISIVHHRSVTARSNSPLVLYGYGSYETPIDPYPSVARLSLLDRGVVYVTAHIRGGGELGRHWYEDGKLLVKKNTFTDFVDSGRHLVDTGWTSPDRMVGFGGSAGGLLVGAAVNEAPDLFAGVLAVVPFVDALTTILDPSLPLTVVEWDEWGDPLHDPDVYAYMKSYTPYENIAPVAYPAIYAPTSIHDTRVYYVEPAKWVARLRERTTGDRPILLKVEMEGGHGGVSGRYNFWRQTADYNAWMLDILGLASS
jgi:oligopeptidase B